MGTAAALQPSSHLTRLQERLAARLWVATGPPGATVVVVRLLVDLAAVCGKDIGKVVVAVQVAWEGARAVASEWWSSVGQPQQRGRAPATQQLACQGNYRLNRSIVQCKAAWQCRRVAHQDRRRSRLHCCCSWCCRRGRSRDWCSTCCWGCTCHCTSNNLRVVVGRQGPRERNAPRGFHVQRVQAGSGGIVSLPAALRARMMGSSTLAQPHAGLTRVAAWALAAVGGAGVVVSGAGVWGGAACAIGDAAGAAGHIAGVAAWALAAVLGACVVVSGAGVGVGAACAIEDAVGLAGHVA